MATNVPTSEPGAPVSGVSQDLLRAASVAIWLAEEHALREALASLQQRSDNLQDGTAERQYVRLIIRGLETASKSLNGFVRNTYDIVHVLESDPFRTSVPTLVWARACGDSSSRMEQAGVRPLTSPAPGKQPTVRCHPDLLGYLFSAFFDVAISDLAGYRGARELEMTVRGEAEDGFTALELLWHRTTPLPDASSLATAFPTPKMIAVEHLLEVLRARVRVQSTADGAVTATIEMPATADVELLDDVAVSAPGSLSFGELKRLAGRKILIVEDHSHVRGPLTDNMIHDGLHVHEASNAKEAMDALREMDPQAPYDFFLFDIHLPDMSGDRLFNFVRKDLRDRVIFWTGAAPSDRLRDFAAKHAIPLFTKPASREDLYRVFLGRLDQV